MSKKAVREQEKAEARVALRELLPPGSTVYTVLRHVSRSGMSRAIDAYVLHDGDRTWLTHRIATACGMTYDRKREAITMGGCGMDMGFALVYELAHTLYPNGYGCIGERCPSNDHANGDRNHTPHSETQPHWHQSGGYSLRHEWL